MDLKIKFYTTELFRQISKRVGVDLGMIHVLQNAVEFDDNGVNNSSALWAESESRLRLNKSTI